MDRNIERQEKGKKMTRKRQEKDKRNIKEIYIIARE
jgi:hypothetical protein